MDSNNYYKTFFTKLNGIYKDPLFILIVITTLITSYLLSVQIKIGVPYWDVFNYLNNGLYFAGMGNGGVLYLPPVIPILTSLLFKIGYVSVNAIFIVDSIIFIIGVIGLYLLLNQRFNKIQSFTGGIIFLSLSVVMPWISAGGIDIPAVSFSIWAIYFTVLGIKKDFKFLYLMLLMGILAVLTRYTSVLLIIPIGLYILIDKNYIKKIGLIILAAIIIAIPVLVFLYGKFSNLEPLFGLFTSTAFGSSAIANDVAYNPNIIYYFNNILNYISVGPFQGTYSSILNPSNGLPSIFSYLIAITASIGLLLHISNSISKIKFQEIKLKLNYIKFIKIGLIAILTFIFLITFSRISYIISEVIFLGICYVTYNLLKNLEIKNLDIDFLFISWFMAYFIFHSILAIKVDRYFITMTPALVYFLILGLSEFINFIRPKIKNQNLKSWEIYSIIALIFLSTSVATFTGHTPKKCFTMDIEDASEWLEEYDPNYKDKIIYSDYPNAVSWYLKKGVNGGFPRLYKSYDDFSIYLIRNNVDYYIDSLSTSKSNIKGYQIVKNINGITIYKKL